MSDSSGGSDTWTDQSNDTASDSGAETVNSGLSFSSGGSVSGYSGLTVSVSGSATSSDTLGGTDTAVSVDSYTGNGSDSWSQSQSGTYGNFSFAFSNVIEQSGGSSSGCLSDSSVDTFLGVLTTGDSSGGQDSGTDDVGGDDGDANELSSASGTVTQNEQIDSTDTVTGGDSSTWSEYQSGSYAGGSFAWASLNDSSSGADSTTETDSSTSGGTFSGTGNGSDSAGGGLYGSMAASDTAMLSDSALGHDSGTDTGTSGDTVQSGDCWSLSEQGRQRLVTLRNPRFAVGISEKRRLYRRILVCFVPCWLQRYGLAAESVGAVETHCLVQIIEGSAEFFPAVDALLGQLRVIGLDLAADVVQGSLHDLPAAFAGHRRPLLLGYLPGERQFAGGANPLQHPPGREALLRRRQARNHVADDFQ